MAVLSGDGHEMICTITWGASHFGGMKLMYSLMSAVHAAPWFRLFAARRDQAAFDRIPGFLSSQYYDQGQRLRRH